MHKDYDDINIKKEKPSEISKDNAKLTKKVNRKMKREMKQRARDKKHSGYYQ